MSSNHYPSYYREGDSVAETIHKLKGGTLFEDPDYRAVELPNSKEADHSPIFRNKLSENGLINQIHPQLDSFPAVFEFLVESKPDEPAFSFMTSPTSNYESITFRKAKELMFKLCSGIHAIFQSSFKDVVINNTDFVLTLYSPNRYEWLLTDIAAQYYSIVSTSLYDTLGPNSTKYILEKTKSPIIFLAKTKIETLLTLINDSPELLNTIKVLISFDELNHDKDSHLIHLAKTLGIHLYDFEELIHIGSLNFQRPQSPPSPNTNLCISFTSGTSGTPKGVWLTQRNCIASTLQCVTTVYKSNPNVNKSVFEDNPHTFVLYPLAHVMERSAVYIGLTLGSNIFFPYGDDIKQYIKNLPGANPNSMSGVPRVFNRIVLGLKAKLDPVKNKSIKVKLINRAINYKLQQYQKLGRAHPAQHWFYDRILYKLSKAIGFQDIVCLYTGSAPMLPETVLFIRAVFNIWNFVNGYGLTETFGGVLLSIGTELIVDNLGPPGLVTDVRLLDIPEMGYEWNKNRSGELLLKGPAVSPGYLDKEQTDEGYDSKGWFKTGDIVNIDDKGRIRIIDRRKNFFKLSQGEFITPEKIENTYMSGNSDLINQIWCYGDGLRDFLVGFVGIDYDLFKLYLKTLIDGNTVLSNELGSLINALDVDNIFETRKLFDNVEFKKIILNLLNSKIVGKLQGFEKVKNIYIDFEPLNQENDTLTQTLKVKRHIAKVVFKKQIEELYEEGQLITSQKI